MHQCSLWFLFLAMLSALKEWCRGEVLPYDRFGLGLFLELGFLGWFKIFLLFFFSSACFGFFVGFFWGGVSLM